MEYNDNKFYYQGSSAPGENYCSFDFVTIHEFGHTQGINHTCDHNAVMWYRDNNKKSLNLDDRRSYISLFTNGDAAGAEQRVCSK